MTTGFRVVNSVITPGDRRATRSFVRRNNPSTEGIGAAAQRRARLTLEVSRWRNVGSGVRATQSVSATRRFPLVRPMSSMLRNLPCYFLAGSLRQPLLLASEGLRSRTPTRPAGRVVARRSLSNLPQGLQRAHREGGNPRNCSRGPGGWGGGGAPSFIRLPVLW